MALVATHSQENLKNSVQYHQGLKLYLDTEDTEDTWNYLIMKSSKIF